MIHLYSKAIQQEGKVNFQGCSTGYVPGGPTAFFLAATGIIHIPKLN
jgi:hypothetical protein